MDPFVDGRLFGGAGTRQLFEANLADSGLAPVVSLRVTRSTDLRPTWTAPLALVYVDGKHDYWTVTDDLKWAEHLPPGGILVLHDAFSSIGVTLASAASRAAGPGADLPAAHRRRWRSCNGPARACGDRLRLVAQLPWFARNVAVKIALRAGRLVGHRRPDPY